MCSSMGFCTAICDSASPCPSGFHCRDSECVRGDLGGLGDECLSSQDCGPSAPECADVDGDLLCVAPCEMGDVCPDGFECSETSVGLRCAPPGAPLGTECDSGDECRSGICANVCTRLCGDRACPAGFVCLPAGAHMGCFPESWATPPVTDSSGGCAVSTHRGSSGAIALLLIGLVVLRRRLG